MRGGAHLDALSVSELLGFGAPAWLLIEMVKLGGVDPNVTWKGETMLMIAVKDEAHGSNPDAVALNVVRLIELKADILRSVNGRNVLHSAARYGFPQVCF